METGNTGSLSLAENFRTSSTCIQRNLPATEINFGPIRFRYKAGFTLLPHIHKWNTTGLNKVHFPLPPCRENSQNLRVEKMLQSSVVICQFFFICPHMIISMKQSSSWEADSSWTSLSLSIHKIQPIWVTSDSHTLRREARCTELEVELILCWGEHHRATGCSGRFTHWQYTEGTGFDVNWWH